MFLSTLAIGEWSVHSWLKNDMQKAQPSSETTAQIMTNPRSCKTKPVSKDKEFLIRFLSELPKM